MSPLPALILFVDHTARMGGGEIALLNLARAIDASRYTPVVLLFADGPLREKLLTAGVETHLVPLAEDIGDVRKDSLGGGTLLKVRLVWRTLAFAWRVRRVVCELRPAVVHTNSLKSDVIGGLAARSLRLPLVWHVRDRIADDYLPAAAVRAFRWMARWVPTLVIANSRATLATLHPETSGVAIPSGVDIGGHSVIHDGVAAEIEAEFAKVGSNDATQKRSGPIVGLVGRLTRWKGQHVFIEVARLLRERLPGARFRMIGSALFGEEAYEHELRELVVRRGLEDVVEFAGFRSDVGAAIAELDLLVHASITGEPFGQVIIEGMLAGKPVVATNGGGVPEIVVDGETGLLVPMGDAPAMAAAIARICSDPAMAARMGERGRERVRKQFTIERTARMVEAVYDRLLADR